MIVSLDEAKNYLRVDTIEDDGLISSLLVVSEKLCLDIIRVEDSSELDDINDYDEVRIPILYATAYLYEHREEADFTQLTLTLRSLLFGMRKEGF